MRHPASAANGALNRFGVFRALEAMDRNDARIRVLAYHRIDHPEADPDLEPGLISATPDAFRSQLELIGRRYRPVSLDQFLAATRGEAQLPPRSVLLTFDDAYEDFARQAWPILRAYGVPATLFVPTAYPDAATAGFWWDRLHAALARTDRRELQIRPFGRLDLSTRPARRVAYKRCRTHVKTLPHAEAMAFVDRLTSRLAEVPRLDRVLSWATLRKLSAEGVAVCPHSHQHALLNRLDRDERERDLVTARQRFRESMHFDRPVMAYPANAVDDAVMEDVARVGYTCAFGGRRGVDTVPPREPLDIMRLPVQRYPLSTYRAQLRPGFARIARRMLDTRKG